MAIVFVEYEYRILHISVPIEKIIFAKKLTLPERVIFLGTQYNTSSTIMAGAYPGFCMKRLGVFLLSLRRDASPSQGYHQH